MADDEELLGLKLVAPVVVVVLGLINVVAATYELYLLYFYLRTRRRKIFGGRLPRCTSCRTEELGTLNDEKPRKEQRVEWMPDPNIKYPTVTIQLPAYNELTCLEGLLHSVSRIHWPRERLQIQLLDDSTLPEAVKLAERVIAELQQEGITIEHCTRENRVGYKAGNLLHHFDSIRGEYVALFDADFLPAPDFLLKTIPHFFDGTGSKIPDLCLVQATWVHYNQTDNLLTHVQGIIQNAHFVFQQNARCHAFGFMTFNGTAGVWTKDSIRASGNWNYDTVTEDLDIACRAKVNGYRFVYLENVTVPSELPPTMMAYKRQQRRWTQGHIQVGRKILGEVWKSKLFSVAQKIDITHMVFNKLNWVPNSIGTFVVPLLFFSSFHTSLLFWLIIASALYVVLGTTFILVVVLYDTKFIHPDMTLRQRMRRIYVVVPFHFMLQLGMTFWQAVSAIEGIIFNDIPFATTPKAGNNEAKADEEQLQIMADADDLDLEKANDESEDEVKELHFDGWNDEAAHSKPTIIKRRKPGMLSKSFPKWSHFVELSLACYWLITPLFYPNRLYGIPVMISSFGFWWVALPGVRSSLVHWSKAVSKKFCGKQQPKKSVEKTEDLDLTDVDL